MIRLASFVLAALLAGNIPASELATAARIANARRTTPATLGSIDSDTRLISLAVKQSTTLPVSGATAAWAVDASVVDVSAGAGQVALLARSPGRTKVMIVTPAAQHVLDVIVTAPARAATSVRAAATSGTTAEVRYSSAAREIQNDVTFTNEGKDRKTELHVTAAHRLLDTPGARAGTALPVVSYRIFTGARELTFFDRDVNHSPLTLAGTPLRGVHYVGDAWRLHAGYTAWTTHRSFLIPIERQLVLGGGYRIRLNERSTVTPSVFSFDGEGTVASMLYAYDDRDRLALHGEVGYSDGVGAAGDLTFDSERDRVRADLRYRPRGFADVQTGSPRGFFGDASWSHRYGRGSNAALSFSANNAEGRQVVALSTDAEHRLTERLSLTGGVSWGSFDSLASITAPVGFRYDTERAGLAILYRYAMSGTNLGGHGFRLSGRASLGRLRATAYVDRQQNAPTLDVIFTERPDLALALADLGIAVTSPADIARALREHASLVELGFVEGVTVDFAPMRTQFGVEAAWIGSGAGRDQFRIRLARNVSEGVARRAASTIATLSYSRRLAADTDVYASYSHWRTEQRGVEPDDRPFFEAGVKQRFDGLPSLLDGSGTISGEVFVDEDLDGLRDGAGIAAIVELDGTRTEKTNADGSFRFRGVERGLHRLSVRVPDRPEAFFTTASRVEVETGDVVAFGVANTPARLNGRVTSDAGTGIAGVRVLLSRGGHQVVAATESDGGYAVVAAPGEWQLSLLTDSVPAGYSLSGLDPRGVRLERTIPREESFSLRALRSIAGSGATPHAVVAITALGKTVKADAEGRFSFRSLPAGDFTVASNGVEKRVELLAGPSSTAVDFSNASVVATVVAPRVPARATGERRDTMHGYAVQLGAFRIRANAEAVVARSYRSGVEATIDAAGHLLVVRAGPYDSRAKAVAAADHLRREGLETVVVADF